jgi:hypothetical protein
MNEAEVSTGLLKAVTTLLEVQKTIWNLPQEVKLFQYLSKLCRGSGDDVTSCLLAGYDPLADNIKKIQLKCGVEALFLSRLLEQEKEDTPNFSVNDISGMKRFFDDLQKMCCRMLDDIHTYYSPPHITIQIDSDGDDESDSDFFD